MSDCPPGCRVNFYIGTLKISHDPLFMISVKQSVFGTQEYLWTVYFDLPSMSTPERFLLKAWVSNKDWRFYNLSQIIIRVDWTIVVYLRIRIDPLFPPPPPSKGLQLWALVSFQIILTIIIFIYSNRMFTEVVSPKGSVSLSAIAETRAIVNT